MKKLIKLWKEYLNQLSKHKRKVTLVSNPLTGGKIETKIEITPKPSFEDFMNYLVNEYD